MIFQLAKAMNGKPVSAQYIKELIKTYPNDMSIQVYGYTTLAYLGTADTILEDMLIKYFANNTTTNTYGVYTSTKILRAVFLR